MVRKTFWWARSRRWKRWRPQAALIADLSKKSELAYENVQDIANRAVTAARRESYLPSVQHAGVAVRDDKQG